MASFEPIICMDENAFIRREKMQQPKMGRKALTDMTNTKKPLAKDRSSMKNLNSLKASEKLVQPKMGRKALTDMTNAWEGFQHSHGECIKKNRRSLLMNVDYFLETIALKRDSSALQLPQLHESSTSELDNSITIEEMEFLDISAPPSPPTPRFAGSPCRDLDFKILELSPLRLKDLLVLHDNS